MRSSAIICMIAAGGGVDTLRLTTDASVVDADLAQKVRS